MLQRYLEILEELQKEKDSPELININSKPMVVDGTNFYLRCFSANPTLNENGEHLGGSIGFLKSLALNIKSFKPSRVIITFDGKGGSSKRKSIFSDYKANRLQPKTFNRIEVFDNAEDEERSLRQQFASLVQYLRCLPVTVLILNDIEADDVIAYLAKSVLPTVSKNILLVSDDKDFLQFVNESVNVYRPVEKKIYKVQDFIERFKIPPYNYHLYKVFVGDDSDNIPGIKGIGDKSIIKMEILHESRIIGIDEFLTHCEENQTNKIYKKVLTAKDEVIRNYKLMQLHDVDIPTNHKLLIQDKIQEPISLINSSEFLQILSADNAYSYMKDPMGFLGIFQQLNQYALTTKKSG